MQMEMQGIPLLTWVLPRVTRATRLAAVVLALPDPAPTDVVHAPGGAHGVRLVVTQQRRRRDEDIDDHRGRLRPGAKADFVHLDPECRVRSVWRDGIRCGDLLGG